MNVEVTPVTPDTQEVLENKAPRQRIEDVLDGIAILEAFIYEGEDGPGEHFDYPELRSQMIESLYHFFPLTDRQLIHRRIHSWPIHKLNAIPIITQSLMEKRGIEK